MSQIGHNGYISYGGMAILTYITNMTFNIF